MGLLEKIFGDLNEKEVKKLDKIADETITDDAEGLMAWMAQVDHPALSMDPLL